MLAHLWRHCFHAFRTLLAHRKQPAEPIRRLRLEELEPRLVPTGLQDLRATPGPILASPAVLSSTPVGLTPAQISHAYAIDATRFLPGGIVGDGTGQTIAILDAYDNPKFVDSTSPNYLTSDLHMFSAQFGLPEPAGFFTKVAQDGSENFPAVDRHGAWELEETLDVEWAHAIAPGARIILVEASSDTGSDLFNHALAWAANAPGVSAISMSFTTTEFASETSLDGIFTTPTGHNGITFIAASGDTGLPGGWPAFSPNVLSVGGTTLTLGLGDSYGSEAGWHGSGGGISAYETQPAYQKGVVTQSTAFRANPDIAFDADTSSGPTIYDSYNDPSATPWTQVGGTSFSAPAWAGLIAIANQYRALSSLPSLDGATQTLPYLYQAPAADFHDITTGNNGVGAGTGYDLVTGRGTPIANQLLVDMAIPQADPFVASIARTTPAGSTTNTTSVIFTATFNKPVTGVDLTDFQLAATNSVSGMLTQVTAVSPSVYTITVSNIAGNGTLGLNLVDNGTIHDLSGHPLVQQSASAAFKTQTTFASGSSPLTQTMADLDNDGTPDLITANTASNNVSVQLGTGDGSFGTAATFAAGSGPTSILAVDLNGDNHVDLVVTNGTAVNVLLGNGNGTFGNPTSFATGANPTSLVAADLDNDGLLDLIVANTGANSISVLLGTGTGTFANQQTFTVGSQPSSVAAIDVNSDALPDLVIANTGDNTVGVLLANGDGTFATQQTYVVGTKPRWASAADMNGDGKPDLLVTNSAGRSLSVLLGNGNGSFGAPQTFASGVGPRSATATDVNADGRLDVVVTNAGSNSTSVLLNAGNGNFTGQTYTIPANSAPVAVGDTYAASKNNALTVAAPGLLANDSDADADPLIVIPLSTPLNGGATIHQDGSFTYTPNPGFVGVDAFTYKLNDGKADSNTVSVQITVANQAPAPGTDSYSINENNTLSVAAATGVLANDADANHDLLLALKASDPAHGTVVLNPDGSFIYTPALNYYGPDSFTYQATDGTTLSGPATVNIHLVQTTQTVASFTPTASGFIATFNKPFNATQINLYDAANEGFGPADVTLSTDAQPVPGSLLINATHDTITFVQTAGVLTPGTYTAAFRSASNGFVDLSGGLLAGDGYNPGTDYTISFTVASAVATTPTLSIPSFARGPDSSRNVNVPSNTSDGIPITLTNAAALTDASFTLSYDPSLLNISGVSGANLTLVSASGGTASFQYHNAAPQDDAVVLGSILAQVPDSAASVYKTKELLHLGNIVLNGAVANALTPDSLEVVAYLGDANGNGKLSGADINLISRIPGSLDSGFAAFPLLDPVILVDATGDGIVNATDVGQYNRFVANLSTPFLSPLPGLSITAIGADPTLSIPGSLQAVPAATVQVPVNLDEPHPAGSTGLTEATLALTYDPAVFSVSAADIHLGTIPAAGRGWRLVTRIDASTGQIAINLFSIVPISANTAGSLVTIDFHVQRSAPTGPSAIRIVDSVNPNGTGPTRTALSDTQGLLNLHTPPTGAGTGLGIEGAIWIAPAPGLLASA